MTGAHESHRVNLLAFDTSTEVLSIAVQAGGPGAVPFEYCGAGGARASSALLPVIQDLLREAGLRLADLDAIVFGRGPGSFTGLRTACSVAQGLAFGAGIPVLAVDTLLAVAEDARYREGVERVMALLDARMDEVYSAAYVHESGHWLQQGTTMLGAPEGVAAPAGFAIAGNAFTAYGALLPSAAVRIDAMPTAAALLRLAPTMIAAGQAGPAASATPLYIRDKVAQTTAERAAARLQS
jgi:tRNA threonylcarbamoyladenosine biosynthesis protein TsaB